MNRTSLLGWDVVRVSALIVLSVSVCGCRVFQPDKQSAKPEPLTPRGFEPTKIPKPPKPPRGAPVKSVICLYDQKPWISADTAGDRDPEGIQYRIFLDTGDNKGATRDGTFHIEMYRLGKDEKGERTRDLVSDWHYPTSKFRVVSAKLLGFGYHLQLRWARKNLAGSEVEIITQFEDEGGNITRGATKRLRIPKYES